MKYLIILFIGLQTFAKPIELAVNKQSLTCSGGRLKLIAPEISPLIAAFTVANLDHPCFFRIYLNDKAAANGGILSSEVQVTRTTVQEPIYKCAPWPCPFCDRDECPIVGYRDVIEESVYIDILGLRFSAKSKINNP